MLLSNSRTFLYPITEKVTFNHFNISLFVLKMLLKALCFPNSLDFVSLVSLLSVAHCTHGMELQRQQIQLLGQMALWDDPAGL